MKSLKDYSPEYIKEFVSKQLNVSVKNIRLFGSRINGTHHEDSDLDVAVIGECPNEENDLAGFIIGDLEIELHWVEDFNDSWLQNSI